MDKHWIWILIDVFFMIANYNEYKEDNTWYNLLFVFIFFILAMITILFINLGWYN